MRILHRRKRRVLTHNPFAGAQGACFYVGPAGVDDSTAIAFRRLRMGHGGRVCDASGYFSQENIGLTSHVAAVKTPTNEISYTLPAGYTDATFWVQVRPHDRGLELPTLFRPRRIVTDADGGEIAELTGLGTVYQVQKLVSGGVRVKWGWLSVPLSLEPDSFVLSVVGGPTAPSNVSTPFVAGGTQFSIDLLGLQHAGNYVLALSAARDGSPDFVIDGSIAFVPDGDGPDVASISFEEL